MAEGQEKTEAPTPRRRAEAREEGQVARSTDLNAAAFLIVGILLLYVLGMRLLTALRQVLEATLMGTHDRWLSDVDSSRSMLALTVELLNGSLVPFVLLLAVCGLLVLVWQVGLMVTFKSIQPKFSKLSPIKGIQNIVGMRGMMRLVMSLAKVVLITAVAVWLIRADLSELMGLAGLGVAGALIHGGEMVFWFSLKLAVLLLVLGLLDYAYQRWQHEEDLKMSKQDVRDEMKRMDGDPQVKQRRASVARQLAQQRVAVDVPKADVVVTNPTHYAVALRYRSGEMAAPRGVAKGADFMALRVRQIAALHGVPIVERPPLARALYAAVEVGQEVPFEHYAAVAELLAYVYRLGDRAAAAAARSGTPEASNADAARAAMN